MRSVRVEKEGGKIRENGGHKLREALIGRVGNAVGPRRRVAQAFDGIEEIFLSGKPI